MGSPSEVVNGTAGWPSGRPVGAVDCVGRGMKCLWASGETGHFAGSPSDEVGTVGCPSGSAEAEGESLGRKCLKVEWSTGHFAALS